MSSTSTVYVSSPVVARLAQERLDQMLKAHGSRARARYEESDYGPCVRVIAAAEYTTHMTLTLEDMYAIMPADDGSAEEVR